MSAQRAFRSSVSLPSQRVFNAAVKALQHGNSLDFLLATLLDAHREFMFLDDRLTVTERAKEYARRQTVRGAIEA